MIVQSLEDLARAMGAELRGPAGGGWVRRVVTDSREVQSGDLFFAIPGDRFDGHEFIEQAAAKGATGCVCRWDWWECMGARAMPACLVVEDTVAALGRLAQHYRRHVMRAGTIVVAVTGSNGKTTTKRMIDHVLSASLPGRCSPKSFNNHLGVPLTLLSAEEGDSYLVVEIGSNAPGEVAALSAMTAPQVGVITSIGEAHLERLGSLRGVAAEKFALIDQVMPHGLALVNVDRAEIRPFLDRPLSARVLTFGFDASARLRVESLHESIERTTFLLESRYQVELPMPGMHHATNAAAAFAVGRWFGLDPARIIERLGTFQPADGRTRVLRIGGVTLVDDTYNANPSSVEAAIAALRRAQPGRRVFVLGDMLELGPESSECHRRMVRTVCAAGIETLVVVGARAVAAVRAVDDASCATRLHCCDDAEQAAERLATLVTPGDCVWLKGSRAMRLETMVARLQACLAPRAAVA